MLKISPSNQLNIQDKTRKNLKSDSLAVYDVSFSSDTINFSKAKVINTSKNNIFVSFEGLSRAIKSKLYDSDYDITQLLRKYPKSNGVIGSPPVQWINNISQSNKGQSIKDLYLTFGQVANALAIKAYDAGCYKYDKDKMQNELQPKIALASVQMKEAIDKLGFDTDDLEVKFVGLGSNGCVYKFRVDEKDYVIKVYHTEHDKKISSKDYHGKLIESNRAAFIKGLNKPSHYVNYYFADLKNGFMVADYVDAKAKSPLKIIKEKLFGFFFADNNGSKAKENTLNGWNIDFGGIKVFNQLLAKNKTVRYVFSKITNNASSKEWTGNWDKLFDEIQAGSVSNKPDLLLGLIAFAKFLPVNDREERYNKILDQLTEKEINLLTNNIECVPKSHRLEVINKRIKTSDTIKLDNIISSLSYLESGLQLKVLQDKQLRKSELLLKLNKYPDKTKVELIKMLSKDANYEVLDSIRELGSECSLDMKSDMLKLLAKYANREVRSMIFYELRYLPEEIVIDVFKEVIDNSDRDMKKRFFKDLVIIPGDLRKEALSIIKE